MRGWTLSAARAWMVPAMVVSASLLVGCGGGDDDNGPPSASQTSERRQAADGNPAQADMQGAAGDADAVGPDDAAPLVARAAVSSLAATQRLDPVTAVRLLNNATFGATARTLDEALAGSAQQWVDGQLAMTRLDRYLIRARDLSTRTASANPNAVFGAAASAAHFNVNMLWRTYITYDANQLRRRVGAALAEIFVVNAQVAPIGLPNNILTTAAFMDVLEGRAFGNYRDVLMGVSRTPAMGLFLSFVDNRKAAYDADGVPTRVPDENYAREVMQLFTIGLYELNLDGSLKRGADGQPISTYGEDDVFNLARVFTGLTQVDAQNYTASLVVDASMHAPEAARFLGATVAAGTPVLPALNQAIGTLFNHPNVGPFIGKQLIQRLVTSNPSPQYVERVARAFNDNGQGVRGDMAAVVRAILLDDEALVPGSRPELADVQGKLREPMVRMTAVARLLGTTSAQTIFGIGDLSDAFTGIGQAPLKSPSVFNFFRPGYTPPNSAIAVRGLVAPEFQVLDGSAILSGINVVNDFVDRARSYVDIDVARMETLSADPTALVDHVALLLTASSVDAAARADFIAMVAGIPAARRWDRVRTAVQLVASSPAFLVQR